MDGAPPKNFSSAGLPAMTSCHGAYLFVPLFNPIGVPRRHAARVDDERDRRGEDRRDGAGDHGPHRLAPFVPALGRRVPRAAARRRRHGGGCRARWPLPRTRPRPARCRAHVLCGRMLLSRCASPRRGRMLVTGVWRRPRKGDEMGVFEHFREHPGDRPYRRCPACDACARISHLEQLLRVDSKRNPHGRREGPRHSPAPPKRSRRDSAPSAFSDLPAM